jgi:hypothetical protein
LVHTQILQLFKQRNQLVNQVMATLLTMELYMCGVQTPVLGKVLVTLKAQQAQLVHKV